MDVTTLVATLKSIESYIDYVILREKSKTEDELFLLYDQLKLAHFSLDKIIVHNNPQLALRTGIRKVHLRANESSIQNFKNDFKDLSFGQSVHSLEEARVAEKEGIQYLLYGHIFESKSKPGRGPRGIRCLKEISEAVTIPVFAIGGIQPAHINTLQINNIAGFAVMSAIFEADDPAAAAKEYVHTIKLKGEHSHDENN